MKTHSPALFRRRRGVSLVELVVAMAIFSLIGLGAASVTLIAGEHTYSSLDLIRTQDKARLVIDAVNRYIIIAEGAYLITDSGATLRYQDPVATVANGGTAVFAKLHFDSGAGTLTYWSDESAASMRKWYGLDDVLFEQDVAGWRTNNELITISRIPDVATDLVKVTVRVDAKLPLNDGKGVTEERILFARN